jgi:hypothetical protein
LLLEKRSHFSGFQSVCLQLEIRFRLPARKQSRLPGGDEARFLTLRELDPMALHAFHVRGDTARKQFFPTEQMLVGYQ